MARLNIETKINAERGFQDLLIAVGDRHKAKGIVWELFELAQKFWFPDRKLIPICEFKAAGLPEVLFAHGGLAEKHDEGIYVRGSEQQFSWLFQKQEAGRKPKARKKVATRPKRALTGDDRVITGDNGTKRDESSLLSSPNSLLSSPPQISLLSSVSTNEENKNDRNPTGALIVRYKQLWKQAHNSKFDPPMTGKDTGILMRMNKAIGFERVMHLLIAYFAMPDGWAKKEKHKIEGFEARIKEIAAYAESGNFVTRRQAMQQDDHATTFDQIERVRKGEL